MTTELLALRRRDGSVSVARGVVAKHSRGRRVASAVVAVAVGVLLALVFLPVPGLHFFSTWMFPLLGMVIAGYLGTKRGDVVSIEATCPACGKDVALLGGPIEADMWRACPACKAPVEVLVD